SDLPVEVREHFGTTPSELITAMVRDMVENSMNQDRIQMSKETEDTMNLFRRFMFENVYMAPALIPDRNKGAHVVKHLFEHFMEHPDQMEETAHMNGFYSTQDVVDYVAGLTDNYAIELFQKIFIPKMWGV
ncbi:MAG: deoxyguanosinetriphosphate triphosphohydrolase, partial [Veillonella sp.]|nr:deoxyguanosinetriphosphate triphosphohydrolase [Veillonella sp.]